MDEQCDGCKFYFVDGLGWCQRYPPIPHQANTEEATYPAVADNSWCGEWVDKDRAARADKQRDAILKARLVALGPFPVESDPPKEGSDGS